MIFMIQNCSWKLRATCKVKLSYKDFDCFQPQEPFHTKAVKALMEVTFPLLREFTGDLLELICYSQESCLT